MCREQVIMEREVFWPVPLQDARPSPIFRKRPFLSFKLSKKKINPFTVYNFCHP